MPSTQLSPAGNAELEAKYRKYLVKYTNGKGETIWKCAYKSCSTSTKKSPTEWKTFKEFCAHARYHPKQDEKYAIPRNPRTKAFDCPEPNCKCDFPACKTLLRHLRNVHHVDTSAIPGTRSTRSTGKRPRATSTTSIEAATYPVKKARHLEKENKETRATYPVRKKSRKSPEGSIEGIAMRVKTRRRCQRAAADNSETEDEDEDKEDEDKADGEEDEGEADGEEADEDEDEADEDEADEDEADEDEANEDEADEDEADVDRTDVDRADMDEADVDGADMDRADVDRANVDVADVDEADEDEAGMDEAGMDEADVDEAGMDEASVDGWKANEEEAAMDKKKADEEDTGMDKKEVDEEEATVDKEEVAVDEREANEEEANKEGAMADNMEDGDADEYLPGDGDCDGSGDEDPVAAEVQVNRSQRNLGYIRDGRFPRQDRLAIVNLESSSLRTRAASRQTSFPPCSAESHVDGDNKYTPCSALERLGLHITPGIGFSCAECESVILSGQLEDHLKRVHRYLVYGKGLEKRKLLVAIINHIFDSHSITPTNDIPKPSLPLTVVIPGVTIELCQKCSGCLLWIPVSSYQRHGLACTTLQPQPTNHLANTSRWAAYPFKKSLSTNMHSQEKKTRWIYPEGWKLPDTVTVVVQPRALSSPSTPRPFPHVGYSSAWATDNGMTPYIESLIGRTPSADRPTIEDLVELLRRPSQKAAQACRSEELRKAELFLLECGKFCNQYLWEANEYTEAQHNDFRVAIVSGTKAHYNKIEPITRRQYAQALLQYIIFPVRLLATKLFGLEPTVQRLSSVKLGGSSSVVLCATEVFKIACRGKLISEKGGLGYRAAKGWEDTIHQYLYAILTEEIRTSGKVACITDQILCFGALRVSPPTFAFQCANAFTIRCSALQHTLFSILVQSVRLNPLIGGTGKYIAFKVAESVTSENMDENDVDDNNNMPEELENLTIAQEQMESEALEDFGEEDSNGLDGIDLFAKLAGCTLESLSAADNTKLNTPLSVLFGSLKYVQPRPDHTGITYQRSHLSSKWSTARPTAMKERRLVDFSIGRNGQSIVTIDRQSGITYDLPMATFRTVTLSLIKSAEAIAGEFIGHKLPNLYQEFDYTRLVDNSADANSIFTQEVNHNYLKAFHHIMEQNLDQHNEDRLQQAIAIQGMLISIVALTTGICPRAFQFQHFLLDTVESRGRNLFIFNGLPAIGNAKAKQHARETQEALWILPPPAAKIFLFYFGVLRPAVDWIMEKKLGRDLDLLRRKSMFVRLTPLAENRRAQRRKPIGNESENSTDWTLNTEAINNVIQKHTFQDPSKYASKHLGFFPFRITCASLRSMNTALFRSFTPILMETDAIHGTSVVNAAGQHTDLTSNTHYGPIINTAPAALQMSLAAARRFEGVSKVFHALIGLGSVPDQWKQLLKSTRMLPTSDYLELAWWRARARVCSAYNLGNCQDEQKNIDMVCTLLSTCPYIFGVDHPDTIAIEALKTLGDDVLREIMHTVIFGESQPEMASLPPLDGYSVEDFAHAVTCIVLAIQEWQSGRYIPFPSQDANAIAWHDQTYAQALRLGEQLRAQNSVAYIDLCTDVRYFREELGAWANWKVSGSMIGIPTV
ncbi:hypothetical protein BDY19DRAFT_988021 [Irpex rosettiformis]|uniref:Uncharacterized protein n=1 Tax=Irpex rosettiformis TaxID=378272 RepID=A0ACB8UIG1_9APHY|nr:hypothetical protein BDY19DRAFT_988021 [Irpex rosettiformis]